MPDHILWSSVFLASRVEVASSTDTATGVVSKLVDVESMLAGLQAGDLSCHFSRLFTLNQNAEGQ